MSLGILGHRRTHTGPLGQLGARGASPALIARRNAARAMDMARMRSRGVGGLGAISWKNTTADASVKSYQAWLNKVLTSCGYYGIAVDGKVGPGTCGAGAMIGDMKNAACAQAHWASAPTGTMASVMAVCQSFTLPTKKGTKQPDKLTSDLPPEKLALPWGVQDPRTGPVQGNLNNDLLGHDFLPIPVTGALDAQTCGAMKLAADQWGMDYLSAYGLNCQAFTMPTPKPKAAAPPPAAPPTTVPVDTTLPPFSTKPKMSTAMVVGGAVALSAAGVAVYYVGKKKGWF